MIIPCCDAPHGVTPESGDAIFCWEGSRNAELRSIYPCNIPKEPYANPIHPVKGPLTCKESPAVKVNGKVACEAKLRGSSSI